MEQNRKRVLLLVYACSPYRGSEPGVGWHRVWETAKYCDVWIICEQHEFKVEIEQYLKEHSNIKNLNFNFVPRVPHSDILNEILMNNCRPLYYITYNLWHRRAYRFAVELHNRYRFDIIHQINLCGFREPGYLWKIDVPFIWGPVGGTQNYPWRFLFQDGIRGALKEALRSIMNLFQLYFSSRVRKAAKRASLLLTANTVNMRDFKRIHNINTVLFPDIGIDNFLESPREINNNDYTLKILWSGELEHHKALPLLLRALSKMPDYIKYELRILGKGYQGVKWRKLAKRIGVSSKCNWVGYISLKQAMAQYDWADVFVFTSLRDTGGSVVLEALSKGVPVICFNHNGAGDIVNSDCGIKIPVSRPNVAIFQLCAALISLTVDRIRLNELSRGAVERARKFSWTQQGRWMSEIYQQVLRKSNAKSLC